MLIFKIFRHLNCHFAEQQRLISAIILSKLFYLQHFKMLSKLTRFKLREILVTKWLWNRGRVCRPHRLINGSRTYVVQICCIENRWTRQLTMGFSNKFCWTNYHGLCKSQVNLSQFFEIISSLTSRSRIEENLTKKIFA